MIQGVESPPRRQSLVLENFGATPPTSRVMLDEPTSSSLGQTTPSTRRQSLVTENQSATPPSSLGRTTPSTRRQKIKVPRLLPAWDKPLLPPDDRAWRLKIKVPRPPPAWDKPLPPPQTTEPSDGKSKCHTPHSQAKIWRECEEFRWEETESRSGEPRDRGLPQITAL